MAEEIKFKIRYDNPSSPSNGQEFMVRESEHFPHHYLMCGGGSFTGGGTLLKKYCVKL